MAATPRYATFTLIGQSRKTYSLDVYFSDVAAALANFDQGSGASATSPTSWRAPEPCAIVDLSVVTGMADTTKIQVTRNQKPTGDILRLSIHETTLAYRPRLNIPFGAGQDISAIQLA